MTFRAAIVALAMVCTALPAAALDPTRWERDVQLIERGVIQAIDAEFLRSNQRENWKPYAAGFRQGLERFEDVISRESFQIMLEIHRQLEADFSEIDRNEKWQDASFYLRNKFALVSFTLNVTAR